MIFTKILQNTLKQDLRLFKKVRPLPKGKNKKVIGLIKDELDEEVMQEFLGLRVKIYSYLKDSKDEDKKAKGAKKKT